MLRVLCSTTEQGEHGGAVAVGDRIERPAGRVLHGEYGTELDAVEWRLDHDAAAEPGSVVISGRVEAISAVFVELTRMGDCAWEPGRGTAHLERLDSTSDTRRSGEAFESVEEGDEHLWAWVVTLTEERIDPS